MGEIFLLDAIFSIEGDPRLGKVTREPKVYTSRMSFLLTVGFLKVGNQPITGNRKR